MPGFPFMRVPAEQQLTDMQDGFAGGLNTTGDAFELQRDQVTRAENARLSQFGSAMKRLGTQRIMSAVKNASMIQGGYCWRKADGSIEHLMVCNGVLYTSASLTIPVTYTAVAVTTGPGLSTLTYVSFVAFRDATREVLYLADGGQILKYDPIAGTFGRIAATVPPAILYLAVYNQRLFGVSSADQTIWYSALNDGDTLGITPDGGQAVVRTFGNQKITTIQTLRDSLAIFHVSGISRFAGLTQDDISIAAGVQGFSSDVGTLFTRSMIVIDGQCFFLSDRGAYFISDSGVTSIDVPKKPDPTVVYLSSLDDVYFTTVTAAHDRAHREVHWSIPNVGVFVFNYRLGAWTGPWTGAYTDTNLTSHWEAVDDENDPVVLFGNADGFIRLEDATGIFLDDVNANGTGGNSFTFAVTCRRMFTRRAESEKSLRWAYVFADLKSSSTALLSWNTAYGSGSYTIPNTTPASLWGVGIWGTFTWGGSGASRFRIPLGGRGPYVDFTISDDGQSDSIFSRVELVAFDLGPRG